MYNYYGETTGSEMEVFVLAYAVRKVMEKSEKMTRQLDQINKRISYIEKTLNSIEKKLEKKD